MRSFLSSTILFFALQPAWSAPTVGIELPQAPSSVALRASGDGGSTRSLGIEGSIAGISRHDFVFGFSFERSNSEVNDETSQSENSMLSLGTDPLDSFSVSLEGRQQRGLEGSYRDTGADLSLSWNPDSLSWVEFSVVAGTENFSFQNKVAPLLNPNFPTDPASLTGKKMGGGLSFFAGRWSLSLRAASTAWPEEIADLGREAQAVFVPLNAIDFGGGLSSKESSVGVGWDPPSPIRLHPHLELEFARQVSAIDDSQIDSWTLTASWKWNRKWESEVTLHSMGLSKTSADEEGGDRQNQLGLVLRRYL